MKTLIEASIKPAAYTDQDKTVFNSTDADKTAQSYTNIANWPGRKMYFNYTFEENGSKREGVIQLRLPSTGTEATFKDFIVQMITIKLKS